MLDSTGSGSLIGYRRHRRLSRATGRLGPSLLAEIDQDSIYFVALHETLLLL
jgi:hypothetical protein